ncbi:hypothetical protein CDR68_18095 [Salmonella enterica]|nr:hypothetical protein [Salmonella enterica]
MTVKVTDSAGKPMAGAYVRIQRGVVASRVLSGLFCQVRRLRPGFARALHAFHFAFHDAIADAGGERITGFNLFRLF